jgi:hypothetical protein
MLRAEEASKRMLWIRYLALEFRHGLGLNLGAETSTRWKRMWILAIGVIF